jgi:RNA polymerase sigma factor (sigma-70 family)
MNDTNETTMTEDELIEKYAPMVKATARRYAGRGAEYEDLVQEGFLALLILIRKCADKKWLTAYIAKRLPGYVRTAAQRYRGLRSKACFVDFEFIPEVVFDPFEEDRRKIIEIIHTIKKILLPEEYIIARDVLDGWTQNDLASKYDISQQAVSARMKKIRAKLEPVFLNRE